MIKRLLFLAVVIVLVFGCNTVRNKIEDIRSSPPVVALTAKCHYRYTQGNPLPDPKCTPGATNPAVHEGTVGATVCTPGWTKTVRPPTSYTTPHKIQSMREYGLTGQPSRAEYDHLISLQLGGSPQDLHNLWSEPGNSPNRKDAVEDAAKRYVCDGTTETQRWQRLTHAQHLIATDWTALGRELGVG